MRHCPIRCSCFSLILFCKVPGRSSQILACHSVPSYKRWLSPLSLRVSLRSPFVEPIMRSPFLYVLLLTLLSFASASPFNARPFESFSHKRQLIENTSANELIVDLGYERYQGVANASTGLNTWKGYMALPKCTAGRCADERQVFDTPLHPSGLCDGSHHNHQP